MTSLPQRQTYRHRHRDEFKGHHVTDQTMVQLVPGFIFANTEWCKAEALREAHNVLMYVPSTAVHVRFYEVPEGMKEIERLFGYETMVKLLATLIETYPDAEHPLLTIAGRLPHLPDG